MTVAPPSPRTWADKEKPNYFILNTELYDTWDFLLNPPMLRMRQVTAQNLPNGTWTAITWDKEDIDTHGFHSTAVNPTRITPTVPGWYRGYYGVSFKPQSTSADTTGIRSGGLIFNGAGLADIEWRSYLNPSNVVGHSCVIKGNVFGPVYFNGVNDYVEVWAYQNSGGTKTTDVGAGTTDYEEQPEFGIRWVSK